MTQKIGPQKRRASKGILWELFLYEKKKAYLVSVLNLSSFREQNNFMVCIFGKNCISGRWAFFISMNIFLGNRFIRKKP